LIVKKSGIRAFLSVVLTSFFFLTTGFAAVSVPKDYLIGNVPLIRQGIAECGPTSLSMVLNYYGIKKTKDDLKEDLNFSPKRGISPVSMVSFPFNKYDFKGEIILNGTLEDVRSLVSQNKPVIVRQYANMNNKLYTKIGHYRVVVGYNDEKQIMYVNDPDQPDIFPISYRDFLEFWDMTDHPGNSTRNFMLVLVPVKKAPAQKAGSKASI